MDRVGSSLSIINPTQSPRVEKFPTQPNPTHRDHMEAILWDLMKRLFLISFNYLIMFLQFYTIGHYISF